MSRLLTAVLFAGLALGSSALAANAEGPIRLRFDPFAQPGTQAAGSGRPGPAASQRAWSPELRATLVSGERSLVNLGGTILELGEEAHGYRLLEVREDEAVFERAGSEVVLQMTGPEGGGP